MSLTPQASGSAGRKAVCRNYTVFHQTGRSVLASKAQATPMLNKYTKMQLNNQVPV